MSVAKLALAECYFRYVYVYVSSQLTESVLYVAR